MIEQEINKQGKQEWYVYLPWAYLFISLMATFSIWQNQRHHEYARIKSEFDFHLDVAIAQVNRELALYEESLQGIAGFFSASDFVSAQEFEAYVHILVGQKSSHGLFETGFAKLFDPLNPSASSEEVRLGSGSARKISKLYAPVVYVVRPTGLINLKTYDAFSNAEVKRRLSNARNFGKALITPVIGDAKRFETCKQCFSIAMPVQVGINNSASIATEKSPMGWAFFVVDAEKLFNEALSALEKNHIHVAVYDGVLLDAKHLTYKNSSAKTSFGRIRSQPRFYKTSSINMYGHQWLVRAESLPELERQLDSGDSKKLALLGVLTNIAITGVFFLMIDRLRAIAKIRKTNLQLQVSEQRWQFALEGAGDGVWDWDIVSDQVAYSKRMCEMLGYREGELIGGYNNIVGRIHEDDLSFVMESLNKALQDRGKNFVVEYRIKCKDGSWKWCLARGMVVSRDEGGKPLRMVGTIADISTIKKTEETIWLHANIDPLTSLPNRRMIYTRFEYEIEKAKKNECKLGVLFLDLDRFKEVNDTLGHDQGDMLLQQAAKRISSAIFAKDTVARLGGDEFIVLVSDLTAENTKIIETVAEKLLKELSEPFRLNHQSVFVGASIGIAVFPDDAKNVAELIRCVDQAMYASKHRGGNCFTYYRPQMQERAMHRMQLTHDLRFALSKKELFLEYQPVVELKTGEIYKAEALLRWRHSSRGLISPGEFIPIAEDTRLINEIGRWVFDECIEQSKIWQHKLNPRFQIAVNKSPVEFSTAKPVAESWINQLYQDGETTCPIVVEITESALLDASSATLEKLQQYEQHGVPVALDDFGTGYSSLSHLRKFDIDFLKIDRSFVSNIQENSEDSILCEAIIVMAHRLGIQVIAEGIETRQQFEILLKAGCDYGQGYYFSRPILADEFEIFVKEFSLMQTGKYVNG